MSKHLYFAGDAQAEALSIIVNATPGLRSHAVATFLRAAADAESAANERSERAIFCQQEEAAVQFAATAPERTLRFPKLDCFFLWPFQCVNPFNAPEPPRFPNGRFPDGNSYVVASIRNAVPAERIIERLADPKWDPAWPDPWALYRSETARLLAKDARLDVRLGAYLLKYFRKKRLFVGPQSPANTLLVELLVRLLDVAFGGRLPVAHAEIESTVAGFGARDILGACAVPIHPAVAARFSLLWYRADESYTFYDEERVTHDEYYRRMIEAATPGLAHARS